jgi:hypothetical protein
VVIGQINGHVGREGGSICHGYIVGCSRAVSLARVLRRWKCPVMQFCPLWLGRNPNADPAEATAKSGAENLSFRSATCTSQRGLLQASRSRSRVKTCRRQRISHQRQSHLSVLGGGLWQAVPPEKSSPRWTPLLQVELPAAGTTDARLLPA